MQGHKQKSDFELQLETSVDKNDLEAAKQLFASEGECDISGMLSHAASYSRRRMLALLLNSRFKGEITGALSNVISLVGMNPEQDLICLNMVRLLLASGREGDITKLLVAAARREDGLGIVKQLLAIGRGYNMSVIKSELALDDVDVQPEILAELEHPSYAEYAVRTGKIKEGSETHHWQVGGLRFLAARAVVNYESGGSEVLPLKFRPG